MPTDQGVVAVVAASGPNFLVWILRSKPYLSA